MLGTRTLGGDHQLSSLVNAGLELEGGREGGIKGGREGGIKGGREGEIGGIGDWRDAKEKLRKGWSGGDI